MKSFFLVFSKKIKKKFRYYKNRIYICCEMKPELFLVRKKSDCCMDLESQTILTNIIRGMVLNSGTNEFDIIIIGGGATGAGTARDCSLRGMRVLLVERFDFAAGATGRNHGLLHSGARYAVTDRESAAECIKENMILRKIARH